LPRGSGDPRSLSVEAGKIVAILGPSGAGKTTLLRTLLGLEEPLGGDIRYGGASIHDAPPGPERPFAWVPQDSPLLADTLAANVSLGLGATEGEVQGLGAKEPGDGAGPDSALVETLRELGAAHLVEGLGNDRLGAGGRAVSGGERQWIAIARALATKKPVLLLDEPTSGLDPDAQALVLSSIARLRGQRSIVLVTHRPEPLAIADTVVRVV
jgi:ABC-type bacteriocin/lantibiotic exporter with double-glycine peptidase domain